MEHALGQIRGFTMLGGQAVPAIVRAEAAPGICALHVAGLPDGTGADLAARVVGALQAVGVAWPETRLQIDIRPRRGPIARELDLAAALAALVALGKLQQPPLARFVAAAG